MDCGLLFQHSKKLGHFVHWMHFSHSTLSLEEFSTVQWHAESGGHLGPG